MNLMQQNKKACTNTKLHYLYVIFGPLQQHKRRSGALTKTHLIVDHRVNACCVSYI